MSSTVKHRDTLVSVAACHSSITAYDRQGRQRSDWWSSSRDVQSPAIRRSTRSPLGNASVSPSPRMAMYWAVHGPMPRNACSAFITRLKSEVAVSDTVPAVTARASVRMVSARAEMTPSSSIGALRSWAATGNVRSSPSVVSTGAPKRAARRPAMVVAAATDTCWPRMARTASSKPSQAPGVRMPGCRCRIPPISASPARCLAITSGLASRSNIRRTRSTITGRARECGNRTSRSIAGLAPDCLTWIVPVRPLISIVRR